MILPISIATGAMIRVSLIFQMTPTSPVIPIPWENTPGGGEQSEQADQIQDKIHMLDSLTD